MQDLSIREFAELLHANPSTISRILSGKTEEVSPIILAKIASEANGSENVAVTVEQLMEAQGFVKDPDRERLTSQTEKLYRRAVADYLLESNHNVKYAKSLEKKMKMIADFAIITDALTGEPSYWLFEVKSLRNIGLSVGLAAFKTWLDKAMNYYYTGGHAGRLSFMTDNPVVFHQAVTKVSELCLPDEISVILVNGRGDEIIDEFDIPMVAGKKVKFRLVNG